MNKIKRIASIVAFMILDVLSVFASLYLAIRVSFPSAAALPGLYSLSSSRLFYKLVIVQAAIFIIVSMICRCYNVIAKLFSLRDVLRQILSVVISVGVFAACGQLTIIWLRRSVNISGTFYTMPRILKICLLTGVFLIILSLFSRVFFRLLETMRAFISKTANNDNISRVLIFGAGEAGIFLRNKLASSDNLLMKPVVFIDDDPALIGRRIQGIKVIGNRESLADAIIKYHIDEVIIAVPTADRELLNYILQVCKASCCKMRRFGSIDDVNLEKASLTNINFEDLLRRDRVNLNMESVINFVKGKVVMVTGGAGSIGSEICRQVLSFGCKLLIVFDINENGLFFIDNELKEKFSKDRFVMRLGSIRDPKRLAEVMDELKPEIVFHAAAHKHVPMMEINPREAVKNNVFGTYNTAMCAINHKVEKFILISTDKAVNPTNVMGATKRITEMIIQMLDGYSDTDFAAVRFGNVLGSNGSVVPFFQKQINEGGPVTVTHPDMRRYFMTIPEAVQLVLEAGAMANGGEIFVLDMGHPVKIYDLACDLIKLSGHEPNVDIDIVFTGLRPGEKLFEELRIDGEGFDTTANDRVFVMKPIDHDDSVLSDKLETLRELVKDSSLDDIVNYIGEIVPTFKHEKAI